MASIQTSSKPPVPSKAALSAQAARTKPHWIPGEIGIWAFVLSDMTIFAWFFASFAYERGKHTAEFDAGRDALSTTFGTVNSFFLLTASLFVALAVPSLRAGRAATAKRCLIATAVCGTGFMVDKVFEWHHEIHEGLTLNSSRFFQLYYMTTGMHLLHVIIGMFVLAFLWRLATQVQRRAVPTSRQMELIENSATYWHLVDVLWLVIFALVYLMR